MKTSFLLFSVLSAMAHAQQAPTKTFSSPNGITEECRVLPHIPGGKYSAKDVKDEAKYCNLDFYDGNNIALCPKTWSTSPGTMITDISKSGKNQRDYEAQPVCGKKPGNDFIAKFKQTMNQAKTSGTFSPASLMYYHLSRFFDTSVTVPVAVYRSMDKDAHLARVSKRASTQKLGQSPMNRAGWDWMMKSEQNPAAYNPTRELFTSDGKQIYGIIVDGGGERYGTEVNGIRSSWGVGQNNDFQNTPAFLALRSGGELNQAISEGLAGARKDSKINRDLGANISNLQMAIWMKEVSEIVILDYIFSQQDRIGNIDFKWEKLSLAADGSVNSEKMDLKTQRSATQITENMVQRTQLNDNDAGGRAYANFTKKTGMLQKLRHLNAGTYLKLQALATDFAAKGQLYQYFATEFGLSASQLQQAVTLAQEAAGIVKATCKAGQMRFDLYGPKALLTNKAVEQRVDCDARVASN